MPLFGKQAAASTSDHGAPRDPILPEGLTKEEAQLNDSIWKLYSPDEGEPDADIIFFHGLQTGDYEEAFWKTWRAKDQEQLIWPKDWLSKILPNARILSVSYNSSAKHVKGESTDQGDMELLGEILVDDIVLDKRSDIGQTCPVFLVGHCLGGIVIKQFILSVINEKTSFQPRDDQNENEQSKVDRTATFLKNFKGAYFYGTPNGGIPNNVTPFANLLTSPSPILKFLRTLDTHRGRINEDFRQLRSNRHVLTHGIGEARATHCEGFHGVVVPEASARYDVDGFYTYRDADHVTVCQARTEADPTVIRKLVDFISSAVPAIKLRNPQEVKLLQ